MDKLERTSEPRIATGTQRRARRFFCLAAVASCASCAGARPVAPSSDAVTVPSATPIPAVVVPATPIPVVVVPVPEPAGPAAYAVQPSAAAEPSAPPTAPPATSSTRACEGGRYVIVDAGTDEDNHDGTGLVRDTRTGLTWMRKEYAAPGMTQAVAQAYCRGKGMRLPTKDEVFGAANFQTCPFPYPWGTWTSTPGKRGHAWYAHYDHGSVEYDVRIDTGRVFCAR